ncbi:MAG: hypothetical protein GY773_18015 [Actinomycetia bacterium]|nr:hypothetical protein [Actinomycetes bacterium]
MTFTRCPECRSDCVDSCFAEKARSVQLPTVGQMQRQIGPREREMSADNDAYRRLRRDGLQPSRVDGSAEVEGRLNHLPPIDPHANNSRVVDVDLLRSGVQLTEAEAPS